MQLYIISKYSLDHGSVAGSGSRPGVRPGSLAEWHVAASYRQGAPDAEAEPRPRGDVHVGQVPSGIQDISSR